MAILKSVVNVNNGNTGWTRQHVLDALETTFANLGWNAGSAVSGSPVKINPPMNNTTFETSFNYCGGPSTYVGHSYQTQRHFEVTNNGTSSYNFRESFYTSSGYTNITTDSIRIDFGIHGDESTYDHGIQTGDPLVYGIVDTFPANYSTITGLTWGTTYYAIRVDRRDFKLAATAEDATNGIAVNLTAWVNGTAYPYVGFRRQFNVLYNNYEIVIKQGTKLNFYVKDTTSGGTFNIIGDPELGYSTTRIFNSTNYSDRGYWEYPIGNATSNVSWTTKGMYPTENEFFQPQELNNLGIGYGGKVSYGYVNSANPTMKGNIVILPNANADQWNYGYSNIYFKYTVPASGGRSALKLRITRDGHQYNERGKINNITIHSIGSGWVEGDTFTIPGSAVGGVDGTHDILFSTTTTSTPTQTTNGTGTCKIFVTNYGAGNKMYQKSNGGIVNTITFTNATGGTGYTAGTNLATTGGTGSALRVNTTVTGGVIQTVAISNAGSGYTAGDVITITGGDGLATFTIATVYGHGHFAVLKSVNDATKDFGTTYYGIGLFADNYTMALNSGVSWINLNVFGTNTSSINATSNYGVYGGDRGLDYQESNNYINTSDSNYYRTLSYASTSTPTAYPLSIRTYKAQGPQDTNFAIIQFTQTINNVIIAYATFSLNKGPNHGANIWDLNHVWNGAYTTYSTSGRSVSITTPEVGGRWYYSAPGNEPVDASGLAREANYGFFRDGQNNSYYNQDIGTTTYTCNIDTDNSGSGVITYYRNNNYDRYTTAAVQNNSTRTKSVATAANYYKPMKGLPISNRLMPCPYYLPDDYIMLQVATSPGLTQFRTGDTVTVSASEVYEVIVAGYQTQQNGLDNIESNQSIGILFCARTT